ncbi:MAG TPA: hypothetical protein VF187_07145 [Gemmatimonadales bacterium]
MTSRNLAAAWLALGAIVYLVGLLDRAHWRQRADAVRAAEARRDTAAYETISDTGYRRWLIGRVHRLRDSGIADRSIRKDFLEASEHIPESIAARFVRPYYWPGVQRLRRDIIGSSLVLVGFLLTIGVTAVTAVRAISALSTKFGNCRVGKLVLMWIFSLLLAVIAFVFFGSVLFWSLSLPPPANYSAAIAFAVAIPCLAAAVVSPWVLTWTWLSRRERTAASS